MTSTPETVANEPPAPDASPEERLVSSDRARQITAAVEQLPERQRTVFTLCQIAEQSTNEVSQALGLSEATVRVHLFRAVRKLRRLLERER
jgi:RNA polymerase sigma-70 factor (ECF subfamily)